MFKKCKTPMFLGGLIIFGKDVVHFHSMLCPSALVCGSVEMCCVIPGLVW